MKLARATKVFLTTAVAVVALMVGFSGWTRSQNPTPTATPTQDEHNRLVDAVRRGGLREAARIKGSYAATKNASWDAVFADTESLTSHSALVVVGVPVKSVSHLSSNGADVFTDLTVTVRETLKSDLVPPVTAITVTVLGGHVTFDDGTSVDIQTPDLEIRELGTYLFFLSEKDAQGLYHIIGGSQGVFELRQGGVVIPHGRKTDLVVQKYKEAKVEDFLKEVRRAVEKWPANHKCCRSN